MRFAVFGAGAVGGYFGARLAQAGHDVTFIARGDHLNAIQTRGLRVVTPEYEFQVNPARATDDPARVGPVDTVILGVKAWQVETAARAMGSLIGPETMVLPLQNGVDAVPRLTNVLGPGPVIGGVCRIVSTLDGPGVIRHLGADPFVAFGELENQTTPRIQRLYSAWGEASGVTAQIAGDIHAAIWQKFIMIASWSGLGAITRSPIGIFRSLPETRSMLVAALKEILSVAQANHIGLPDDSVSATLAFMDSIPAASTASMQRDIMAGRPSELADQNGAVVRLGEQAGLATPVNTFIYHSLLPLEMQARDQQFA